MMDVLMSPGAALIAGGFVLGVLNQAFVFPVIGSGFTKTKAFFSLVKAAMAKIEADAKALEAKAKADVAAVEKAV